MTDTPETPKDEDGIGKALNLRPLGDVSTKVRELEEAASSKSTETDFELARNNIHAIISNGTDALEALAMIAEQSQDPRAYATLSSMMAVLLAANKDLMKLRVLKRGVTVPAPSASSIMEKEENGKTINNTLVVTTAELARMIDAARSSKKVIDHE